jgi:hypothetical protein
VWSGGIRQPSGYGLDRNIKCKAIGLCTVRGTAGHVLHAKAGHVVSYIRCSTPGVFQCWNIRTFLWLAWRSGVELRPDIKRLAINKKDIACVDKFN